MAYVQIVVSPAPIVAGSGVVVQVDDALLTDADRQSHDDQLRALLEAVKVEYWKTHPSDPWLRYLQDDPRNGPKKYNANGRQIDATPVPGRRPNELETGPAKDEDGVRDGTPTTPYVEPPKYPNRSLAPLSPEEKDPTKRKVAP